LNTKQSPIGCRVCAEGRAVPFESVDGWNYWLCSLCAAVFMDVSQLPDREAERLRYNQHRNDPDDAGYRRFLGKLANPLLERLEPACAGLDYGCGPGPALARMLAEAGHAMRVYDPIFYPDRSVLACTYDFITCTETAEHFHCPAREWIRLDGLLRPGGWLAIMTGFLDADHRFAKWHYRRDPTHVVFYREQTFHHLAGQFGWQCEVPEKNVVLMRKPTRASSLSAGPR